METLSELETSTMKLYKDLEKEGRVRATLQGYTRFFKQYLAYLEREGITQHTGLSQEHNQTYLEERYYQINRYGRQNSIGYRNTEVGCLKKYMTYLYREGYLEKPLAKELRYVKTPSLKLPKNILSTKELQKIMAQPDTTTTQGMRNKVMLEVLYACGLRRSELMRLKLRDMKYEEESLIIRKKDGKPDRKIPCTKAVVEQIKEYVTYVRPEIMSMHQASMHEYVFVCCKGGPLRKGMVYDALQKEIRKAKLKKKVTIYSLRETAMVHVIQGGMPIRCAQVFFGHELLSTTAKYLHLHTKALEREYKKYHPRERGH